MPHLIALSKWSNLFAVMPGGDVSVDGVRVTRGGGWLDLRTLASALARGAPPVVTVRLVLAPGPDGRGALHVAEVVAGETKYREAAHVRADGAEFWRASLPEALRAEIERAFSAARRRTRPPSSNPPPAPGGGNT